MTLILATRGSSISLFRSNEQAALHSGHISKSLKANPDARFHFPSQLHIVCHSPLSCEALLVLEGGQLQLQAMSSRLNDPSMDALEGLRRERQMNRLSNRMNQFHSYFKTQFNMLYELADGSYEKQGLSLASFVQLINDLIHHLTMHHTIEEQTLFPILGKRMSQFAERESRGEHIESHRQIHDGLDTLSELTRKWTSGPSTYSPSDLRMCLDSFREVLFRHLDDECRVLRRAGASLEPSLFHATDPRLRW
ncbi:hypothetical protein FA13DRAFT_927189 [Coprinellus micaceus]|uniref:Hemerythrin-like domain-containing protein n=1 Tax=Coprinellus micaceus TaxID=71717 RepID=A0A4Y7TVR5_COPMI|nr:hypothetical protein FA13DRAFT_927189 [Coprinellus micaceus]